MSSAAMGSCPVLLVRGRVHPFQLFTSVYEGLRLSHVMREVFSVRGSDLYSAIQRSSLAWQYKLAVDTNPNPSPNPNLNPNPNPNINPNPNRQYKLAVDRTIRSCRL